MSFLVAIIGRVNVGKSTLFNVLTHSRDALVFNFNGVTRDKKYGQAKHGDLEYLLVDTGGISNLNSSFDEFITKQSKMAIDEANLVFFVVDGRLGLTHGDQYIAKLLHKKNKKVIVVVNKIDGIKEEGVIAEFYIFGFNKVFAISAIHRLNIQKLLDKFLKKPLKEYYRKHIQTTAHKEANRYGIHYSLVGKPNVGKSTLTNIMLSKNRVLVSNVPGTTIDSVSIPFERNNKKYTVIDTAGVKKKRRVKGGLEKFSVIKTLQSIKKSNVVIAMIDAREGLVDQDLSLIEFAVKNGRGLVIVVNKWDSVSQEDKKGIKKELQRRLHFLKDYFDIHFISALYGTNINQIFKSIDLAYECLNKKITTSDVNRLLEIATKNHAPPMVGKFSIKLRYAHVGGHNPPVIVIHGSNLNKLTQSYKKYLGNFFKEAIKLRGTPIVFEFKQSKNPFVTTTKRRINKDTRSKNS